MSDHKIKQLIDKQDRVEIIRDEIASILAVEFANQQALATAAGRDPEEWNVRVFTERAIPWALYIDAPEQDAAAAQPIVNISIEDWNFDQSASNVVRDQKATAVYHVDCYGYGISRTDNDGGHIPGDLTAALRAQRAVRLVRNILMSGHYTYLGQRGVVWRRWLRSVTAFQPALDAQAVQRVQGVRMQFEVDFSELSPQVQPVELSLVTTTVHWAETGEVLFRTDYPRTIEPVSIETAESFGTPTVTT